MIAGRMPVAVLSSVIACATTGSLLVTSPTSIASSDVSERILFVSWQGGIARTEAVGTDGRGRTLLRTLGKIDGVAWSPDVKRVVVSRGQRVEVVSIADGSRVLIGKHFVGGEWGGPDFAWSPDGTQVAYVGGRDRLPEIYVAHADGSGERALTHNRLPDEDPDWSPDGTKLVFAHYDEPFEDSDLNLPSPPAGSVWVTTATGRALHRLMTPFVDGHYPASPRWSPDGRTIAVESLYGGIDLLHPGTGRTRTILEDLEGTDVFAWSPDGTKIAVKDAYEKAPGRPASEQGLLAILDPTTPNRRVYVASPGSSLALTWSPDGTRVAFATCGLEPGAPCTLFVVDADGTNKRKLATFRTYGSTALAYASTP